MTTLIAMLSSGKGTWAQVTQLLKFEKWNKVYLICNDFAYENFDIKPNQAMKLKFDEKNPNKSFNNLAKFFKKEVKDFEVALNLVSGSGIEHMAVLSAVLKSGLGIRFVYAHEMEVKEFEILEGQYEEDANGFL